MKTIEEKAKAYDKAIEKFKEHFTPTSDGIVAGGISRELIEDLFPKLKESDDERIRKEIYNALRYLETELSWDALGRVDILDAYDWLEKQREQHPTSPKWKYKKDNTPLLRDSIILNKYGCVAKSPSGAIVSDVWVLDYEELAKLPKEELEKQGEQKPNPCDGCINRKGCINCENGELRETEQKPADNVEPKFHEGDWIISNDKKSTYQVIEVKRGIYVIRDNADNHEYHIGIEECEKSGRLWDVTQDAKDGDVLVASDNSMFIYTGVVDNGSCIHHIAFYDGSISTNSGLVYHWERFDAVKPATKAQRDTLFAKMKEAGYEWDAKKKEVKKIEKQAQMITPEESLGITHEEHSKVVDECIFGEVSKQKTAKWTEEDEKITSAAISFLNEFKSKGYENAVMCIDWLKSLKERMGGNDQKE